MNSALRQALEGQHRRVLTVVILAVFSAGLWGYQLLYQEGKYRDLLALRQSEQRLLHDPQQRIGLQVYQQNQADLKHFWPKIPTISEFPRLLGAISDETALQNTMLIRLVYTEMPKSGDGMVRYQLRITTDGNYGGAKRLLAALYQLAPLSTVESIMIRRTDTPPWQVRMETGMIIRLRQEDSP